MDHSSFANLSRDELINRARAAGVDRPEMMTRVELADELVRRAEPDPLEQRRARGWLGVARDLVASVVESGLNLPDAAAVIRGERGELDLKGPEPVATVTLAEIYATQGHVQRALSMLDEVIANEPEHEAAQHLRERLLRERPVRSARVQALALRYDGEPASPGGGVETPSAALPHAQPSAEAEALTEAEAAESEVFSAGEGQSKSEAVAEAEAEAAAESIAGPEDAVEEAAVAAEVEARLEMVSIRVPESSALEDADAVPAGEVQAIPVSRSETGLVGEGEAVLAADAREGEISEPPLESEPVTERPAADALASEALASPTAPTVMLLRGPSTEPVVCWDIGRRMADDAQFAIVCVAFVSTAEGVERDELSVPISEPRGRAVLETVPSSAVVRVALGVEEPDGFVPIAIASELQLENGVLTIVYRPPAAGEEEGPTETERALVQAFASGRSLAAGPLSL